MNEVWKSIPNFKGIYEISDLGRIKSLKRKGCLKERILKPNKRKDLYLNIILYNKPLRKTSTIHSLMALVFLNHDTSKNASIHVNHINHIKSDNRLVNLEVISARENTNLKHIKSSSKYVGVSLKKKTNKWGSQIKINGKAKHLGYFTNEYDAHLAYQNKLSEILNT